MKSIFPLLVVSILILIITCNTQKQPVATPEIRKTYQARAPKTQNFDTKAFQSSQKTIIRWLGNAGFFINARGTTIMVDPLLKGFDMPLLITMPIEAKDVPHLDAILITHSDNDHFSIPTLSDLATNTRAFHSVHYVDSLMKLQNWNSFGYDIGESFNVGAVRVTLTPADHAYQNHFPGATRFFKPEDFCGFWIETPDGTIWATGDSRLMDNHLQMEAPDAIFFDFSDSQWHFGLDGAVKIANAYPNAALLLCHWGSVSAPEMKEFNGDPEVLKKRVVNPKRIHVLAPGEPFTLTKAR